MLILVLNKKKREMFLVFRGTQRGPQLKNYPLDVRLLCLRAGFRRKSPPALFTNMSKDAEEGQENRDKPLGGTWMHLQS